MLIWHHHIKELLWSYIAGLQNVQEPAFPFVLLVGPWNIWKMSLLEEISESLVGLTAQQDLLILEDCSYDLGKPHSIKIEVDEDEQYIEKKDGTRVPDIGVRQLIQRMSMAPAGERKVCILENIERMSIGAANAFLKTAEEPLPRRLIFATSTNESTLLETIRSRAWLIHCTVPPHQEIISCLEETLAKERPDEVADAKSQNYAHRLALFFADRIGLAMRAIKDEKINLATLLNEADELMSLLISKDNPQQAFVRLQSLCAMTDIAVVLEYVFVYSTQVWEKELAEASLTAKRYIQAHVQEDNVLFGLAHGILSSKSE